MTPKKYFFGGNFKKVSEWSETCKNAIKNGGQKKTLNPHNFPQGHFRAKRKRQFCSARRDEHFGISYCPFGHGGFTKLYPYSKVLKPYICYSEVLNVEFYTNLKSFD